MSATLVLLPGDQGHWLRIVGSEVVDRGEGGPATKDDADLRVVGVVPSSDVVVHHAALAGLTDAQARGAARLAVAESAMAPIESLHVAVGGEHDGERTIVAIDARAMTQALMALTERGFDPDAMIAAPLILPRPETGFVSADLGVEGVVRGRDTAFEDDAVLTPLLTRGDVVALDREEIEAAIVAAAANPEVDLRQGPFTKRRNWALDRARLRRIAWLAAACLVSLILIPLVTLIHLNTAAARVEAATLATAQGALPPGTAVLNPVAQLDERLAALGGGGGGFLPLAAVFGASAEGIANVELGAMTFEGDGSLRVSARSTNPTDLTTLETRLAAAGVTVLPSAAGGAGPSRDITVRAP